MSTTATALHKPRRSQSDGPGVGGASDSAYSNGAGAPRGATSIVPTTHADVTHRRDEQDHAADRREIHSGAQAWRGGHALELAGVDPARHAHQPGDVIRDAEELHADEPQVRLQGREAREGDGPAGEPRQHPVGAAHEGQRHGSADGEVEVPLHPGGVVDHRVHRVGGVDGTAETAEREGDHRQRDTGEKRVTPRQDADPAEPPGAATARPACSSEAITVNAVTRLGNMIA